RPGKSPECCQRVAGTWSRPETPTNSYFENKTPVRPKFTHALVPCHLPQHGHFVFGCHRLGWVTVTAPSLGLSALLNKLPNRLGRYRSGLPSHFASGFKQCERRNGIDAKPLRQDRQIFGIHLSHQPAPPPLRGDF